MQKNIGRTLQIPEITGKLKTVTHPSLTKIVAGAVLSLLVFSLPLSGKNKKTIAILEFSFRGIPEKYARLMRSDIEFEFYQSGDFLILERNKIDYVKKNSPAAAGGESRRKIDITMGKTLAADYIVTGFIEKENSGKYNLKLKVINISDGSLLYSYSKKIDYINELNRTTKSFSGEAIKDIKYFDTHGSVKKKKVVKDIPFHMEYGIQGNYLFPLGGFGKIVNRGPGGGVSLGLNNLFMNRLSPGLDIFFMKLNSEKIPSDYYIFVPVLLSLWYRVDISKPFSLSPGIKGGAAYLSYRSEEYSSPGDYKEYEIEPMGLAGVRAGIEITKHAGIGVDFGYGMLFEKNEIMKFFVLGVGVSVSF